METKEQKKRGRIENLKSWKPGQSGNPSGRPKKLPITDAIREVLEKAVPDDKNGRKFNQVLAEVLISMALKGNKRLEALREIMDRAEGKPVQRTEVSGPGGGAMLFDTPGSREELERRLQELLGSKAKPKAAKK